LQLRCCLSKEKDCARPCYRFGRSISMYVRASLRPTTTITVPTTPNESIGTSLTRKKLRKKPDKGSISAPPSVRRTNRPKNSPMHVKKPMSARMPQSVKRTPKTFSLRPQSHMATPAMMMQKPRKIKDAALAIMCSFMPMISDPAGPGILASLKRSLQVNTRSLPSARSDTTFQMIDKRNSGPKTDPANRMNTLAIFLRTTRAFEAILCPFARLTPASRQ